MSLGLYVFTRTTAPFHKSKRQTKENWSTANRFGQRPANQHIGPGEESITLDGVIAPSITGGPKNLDTLRSMQSEGKAWILTSGTGDVLGQWIIESVDETRTAFTSDGQARKIEFTLSLKRYGEEDPDQLGDLVNSL